MSNLPIGLDIGSHTIKLVQLVGGKDQKFELKALGTIPAPQKGLSSDSQADLEMMAIAIKKLVLDARVSVKEVNASLPESQIFSRVIEMPGLTEAELGSAIKWEAEQYIPMPLSEVKMDYAVLPKSQKDQRKTEVLLVAAPLTLIEKYKKVLEMAGLTPVSLEPEIMALSRSLVDNLSLPTLIINLGAKTTDLAIIRKGFLTFTRSISSGGETLAKAVASDMGLEISQAEEYKRTYGLEEDKLEGKILTSVKPILDAMIDEARRSIIFYKENYPEDHLQVVNLCGGTAKLPGLGTYLAENLALEVQIGNPWLKITANPKFFPNINEEGPLFAVACGLAMKS